MEVAWVTTWRIGMLRATTALTVRSAAPTSNRGPDVTVSRLVGELSPDGAVSRVTGDADEVRVTVTVRVAPLGPVPIAVPLSATAVAVREPGSAEGFG